jgi:hypothetical protein
MNNDNATNWFLMALALGAICLGYLVAVSPDTGLGFVIGTVPVAISLWIISKEKDDRAFLLRLYLITLCVRWALAVFIYSESLQAFFGGDAETYDIAGYALSRAWSGFGQADSPWMLRYTSPGTSGWGMYYFVASIYHIAGHSQLVVQSINCALGAAACVVVHKITQMIHPSQRVARTAAVLTAFSPSMILWSSQLLKDAPIVLCLCLCTLYTLKLRSRFAVKDCLLLLLSLFCLFSLRHYAFYIMFIAIAGTLLLAAKRVTPLRVVQGGILIIILGMVLVYFGAGETVQNGFDLKRIQAAREWGAREAKTGFGGDVDITDPKAAIGFLPIGTLYVLFAPFPWMVTNLRQLITLPELLAWWSLIPMLVIGFWHAVRHRLKESFALCVFTVGLTLAYALYQSDVGTAYRHRGQLYVFFFIFISLGLEVRRTARLKRRSNPSTGYRFFAPFAAATGPDAVSNNSIGGNLLRAPRRIDAR